jgi:predicted RNase H-like nuclease (RuvC/YqgF family)
MNDSTIPGNNQQEHTIELTVSEHVENIRAMILEIILKIVRKQRRDDNHGVRRWMQKEIEAMQRQLSERDALIKDMREDIEAMQRGLSERDEINKELEERLRYYEEMPLWKRLLKGKSS